MLYEATICTKDLGRFYLKHCANEVSILFLNAAAKCNIDHNVYTTVKI